MLCPDTVPRGFGQGSAAGAVDEQTAHRPCKGRRIARWDEKAGYPMHDDLADATRGVVPAHTTLAAIKGNNRL